MLTPAEFGRVCVVLVGSRNPLNIGAAARAMSNFGFTSLRVVHPYAPAFREARSAVDAGPVLAVAEEFERVEDAVADCSLVVGTTGGGGRNPQEPLQRLEAGAEPVAAQLRAGSRVALLFGSEKVGLSNQDLSHCQMLLRIPTRTGHPSMNLGQSVAVVLYELIRETVEQAPAAGEALATATDRERLIALLVQIFSLSGYPRRGAERMLEDKLRRLVQRLHLNPADLHEWLGLYRHILRSLQSTGYGAEPPTTPMQPTEGDEQKAR